jgi:hypothetical protein
MFPLRPPRQHDIEPLARFFHERWDVGGVILEIAIHDDNVLAAGIGQTGAYGPMLPKISRKTDAPDPLIFCRRRHYGGPGIVRTPVVDKDDLKIRGHQRRARHDLPYEFFHDGGGAENGGNDAEFGRAHG